MSLLWLPAARNDLKNIRAYIAQHDPKAAKRVGERIRNTVTRLLTMPRSGRPGRAPATREIVIPGTPYLMPYRVLPGRIVILRVLHGRQHWPAAGP